MNVSVDIQVASDGDDPPEPGAIEHWLSAVFDRLLPISDERTREVSVRLVDREESHALNLEYRGKDSPTNVLSFPSDLPPDLPFVHLGDIVVCTPVIHAEAKEQGKPVKAHWAHMCVHGALHLLGYDHIDDAEAEEMEALEVEILGGLGFPDPYQAITTPSSIVV